MVTNQQIHDLMLGLMVRAKAAQSDSMQRLSSGRNILRLSDDPLGAMKKARFEQMQSALSQYESNIGELKSRHQQNEEHLQSMFADLLEVKTSLLQAKDGGNSESDLATHAARLATLRDNLFSRANSKDYGNQYIFSGSAVMTPPLAYDAKQAAGQRYSWNGNLEQQKIQVGASDWLPANVTLEEMADFLNGLDQAIDAASQSKTPGDVEPQLAAALEGLERFSRSVDNKIAVTGNIRNSADSLGSAHGGVSLMLDVSSEGIDGADMGKEVMDINGYLTALEGTQKAYAKMMSTSVWDIL
ncbi:hypothetical protein B0T39_20255 [Chromobacterium haemolyticum]|nr:hypothetical protein B0T39_20255 [Chromobacterium haemolyticum]